jgi:predicted transposase/invertase (TIGR01784 family)
MKLIDPKTNKMVSDKMHGYFIQLPKFKKSNNGCVDHFDEWIYNLKNMERMGNIEFKDQEVFERLWNLSNCSMLSIEERRKYERSLKAYRDYVNQLDFAKNEGRAEGREEGRAEGREEGKAEGKTEERFKIISTLKRKGKSDEEIASLLDLNIEDVKSV